MEPRKFEIPYNFDKNLIDILYSLDFEENIDCIYTCPYWEDYPTTCRQGPVDVREKMPYEVYAEHIKYINQHFPGKLQLLLQYKDRVMDTGMILRYLDLGFTKFCVVSVEQAQIIKNICPDFEVIGSIMVKLSLDDIYLYKEKYSNLFDGFVLFFPFNRNFQSIKRLPKGFKYILLVNCYCNNTCNCEHHWYYEENSNQKKYCPNEKYLLKNMHIPWEESSIIRPIDLDLFQDYIDVFKIQGRESLTREILSELILYQCIDYKLEKYDVFYQCVKDISLYEKKELI